MLARKSALELYQMGFYSECPVSLINDFTCKG